MIAADRDGVVWMAEMDNIRLIIRFLPPTFFAPDESVAVAGRLPDDDGIKLPAPDGDVDAGVDVAPVPVPVPEPLRQEVELTNSGLLARAEARRAAARCLLVSASLVLELFGGD